MSVTPPVSPRRSRESLRRPRRLSSEAQQLLRLAPTPSRAACPTLTQWQAALKRAGRQRGTVAEADRLRGILRTSWAHQPPLVEDALGEQMLALLVQLEATCTAANDLAEAVEETFAQHPDAEVILSFPAWAPSSAPPGCSPRSATTGSGSPTPAV
ncbi:hypothetical protein GCM10010425_65770 [Streptomyces spororaveus]